MRKQRDVSYMLIPLCLCFVLFLFFLSFVSCVKFIGCTAFFWKALLPPLDMLPLEFVRVPSLPALHGPLPAEPDSYCLVHFKRSIHVNVHAMLRYQKSFPRANMGKAAVDSGHNHRETPHEGCTATGRHGAKPPLFPPPKATTPRHWSTANVCPWANTPAPRALRFANPKAE